MNKEPQSPLSPLPLTLASVFKRNRSKTRSLAEVIKILKATSKAHQASMVSRKNCLAIISSWTGGFHHEQSAELLNQITTLSNGQWALDADLGTKIQAIIARLHDLRKEEMNRNKAYKALADAEKRYYRALYKNYSKQDIESLHKTCRSRQEKAQEIDTSFRGAAIVCLTQCLQIFYHQLAMTSDASKVYCDRVMDLIMSFDCSSIEGCLIDTKDQESPQTCRDDDKTTGAAGSASDSPSSYSSSNPSTPVAPLTGRNGQHEHQSKYNRLTSLMSSPQALTFDDIFNRSKTRSDVAISTPTPYKSPLSPASDAGNAQWGENYSPY
uniref:ARAD1D35530p n=1 Tax=Blastobotrys adeninivorans TaxID=409370 RepID=A0A060TH29_BLAAD